MQFPLRKSVRAKSALAASDNSPAVEVWDFAQGQFVAILVADSGTGTLDVKLQTSPDGGTTWVDLPNGAFTQLTGAGSQALAIENVGTHVRAVFTVGTGPFNVGLDFVGRGC